MKNKKKRRPEGVSELCDKSKTAYSINNYYIEQIVALTLQSKGAWTIVMYLAGQMNDENIVYCRRDALCEATGGKLRSVTSWITALQKYGFIYVVRKDKEGWEFAVNPALIVRGIPDKDRKYPMWPQGLTITGPVMESHDKWVENNMAPEVPAEPVVVQTAYSNA